MNTKYYETQYIEHLKNRKNKLMNIPMPKIGREAYLSYFETGNRLAYEKIYFARREYLTIFGLDAVINNELSDELFDILESVLTEATWVLPAHGSREHIDGKKQSIDLFAAETAGTLAEIIYLISKKIYIENNQIIKDKKNDNSTDKMSGNIEKDKNLKWIVNGDTDLIKRYKSICSKLFSELRKRIFDIFLAKNPCDWWETASMNWSAVCGGNVGIAAYYVKKLQELINDKSNKKDDIIKAITDEEYDTIMDRVTDSMICYLKSMGEDGACSEGAGYYKYGMEYFLKFYEILRSEKQWEKIRKIGDFHNTSLFLQKTYLGNGNSVNFADCLLKNKMKLGMICMLSSIYDDVRLHSDFFEGNSLKFDTDLMEILGGEECHRWLGAYSDYIWVKTYGGKLTADNNNNNYYEDNDNANKINGDNAEKDNINKKNNSTALYGSFDIFKETQWYIKKWSDGSAFYIKGGHNDESHNHNDAGSFGYISRGDEILCDLGIGEYTKDYFGEGRYDILCNSSKGHNVPVIDGIYQKAGRKYAAGDFYGDKESVYVSFGNAYDSSGKYTVSRKVVFEENGGLWIYDHVEGADKISERLISRIKPEIYGNTAVINTGKEKIYITISDTYESLQNISCDGSILCNDEKSLCNNENNICHGKNELIHNERKGHTYGEINVTEETHINHSGYKEKVYIISCDYVCNEIGDNEAAYNKSIHNEIIYIEALKR